MEPTPGHPRTDLVPTTRIAEALAALAAVAPPNREEWLRAEFPGDDATQAELLSLVTELSPLRPGEEAAAGAEDPWIGRSIAGCTVEALLGRGGMGSVYRAHQQSTNRMVALKLLGGGAMPGFLAERLRAEGAALGALQHHNIARVYQAGVAVLQGTASPFLVMELVPGACTADRWSRTTRLGPRERIERIARCCDAVQHAHARGIIHGDIKPANVLFGPDDEPKLIDFGTARMAGAIERPDLGGIHALTPAWAAPEQASATRPSASTLTDVYGLGRVAREALAGEHPASLARRQRRDLEAVIDRATAHRPEDRHPTAEALARELRSVAADRPVASRHSPLPERAARLARRHPVALAAALASAAALAAGAVAMFRSDQAMRRAYAISQLSQATIALDGGNREAALAHAALARGVGMIPALLPRMIERQADLACDRVRGFGNGTVAQALELEGGTWVAVGQFGTKEFRFGDAEAAPTAHRNAATCVAMSPSDGKVAIGHRDGSVLVLEGWPGPLHSRCNDGVAVRSLAFTDDGSLAVARLNGDVTVLDRSLTNPAKVWSCPLVPEDMNLGSMVASYGPWQVAVADSRGRVAVIPIMDPPSAEIVTEIGTVPTSFSIHPARRRFVTSGFNGGITSGSLEAGSGGPEARTDHDGLALDHSGDGGMIAIATKEGCIALCDAGTMQELRRIPLGSNRAVTWCAFDRTDAYLVAAAGDSIVRTPVRPSYPPDGHLGLSPRGTSVAASRITAWDNGGAACTFDPRTGIAERWPGSPGPIEPGSGSASPDGCQIAGFRQERVIIQGAEGLRATAPLGRGERARTAWLPDGGALWAVRGSDAWILSGTGDVLASGRIPAELRLPSLVVRPDGRALVVDADRSWALRRDGAGIVAEEVGFGGTRAWEAGEGILVTTASGSVRWTVPEDLGAGVAREFGDPSHAVVTAAWSPQQGLVAGGCSDRKVRVWDFRTGEQLVTFGGVGRGPPAVHWVEGGRVLVAIDLDGRVHAWTDLPVEPVDPPDVERPVSGASG